MEQYFLAVLLHVDFLIMNQHFAIYRDPQEIPDILFQEIQEVKELYQMGYVHRYLKPENIMIRFNPLKVTDIDFNRIIRKENTQLGTVNGSPGYFQFEKSDQVEVFNGINKLLLQQYQSVIQKKMNTIHLKVKKKPREQQGFICHLKIFVSLCMML